MKIKFFIVLLCITLCDLFSFSQNLQWAKSIGGVGDDYANEIIVDDSENIYITGKFVGTVDFDPGVGVFNLTSFSSGIEGENMFISKYDALGNFVWAKAIACNDDMSGISIKLDAANDIYVIGIFRGTADFDPGMGTFNLTSVGDYDIFISKFDNLGNYLWVKTIGGYNEDIASDIAFDGLGNIYITGKYELTVDFDPGVGMYNLTAAGSWDIFISKFDVSGNFIWSKTISGIDVEFAYSIAIDNFDNVFIAGFFSGTVDFDSGLATYNLTAASFDVFVSKFDSFGNFVWAKAMGGTNDDYAFCITIDSMNNIYTTGYFVSNADFDPGLGVSNFVSMGGADMFISKLDNSGNFVWAKTIGGTDDDYSGSITVDASNNVYIGGFFKSPIIDFNPGIGVANFSSMGNSDIFISEFTSTGDFIWTETLGGSFMDAAQSVVVDAYNNLYTIGSFQASVDFDPNTGIFNLSSIGNYDMFVQKLSQPVSVGELVENFNILISPNPFVSETALHVDHMLKNATLIVYNSIGVEVKKNKNIYGKDLKLERGSLESGIYFIRVLQENNIITTQKVMIMD